MDDPDDYYFVKRIYARIKQFKPREVAQQNDSQITFLVQWASNSFDRDYCMKEVILEGRKQLHSFLEQTF